MRPLALTPGEPAGIGPEITLKAAQQDLPAPIVAIADPAILEARAKLLRLDVEIVEATETKDKHTPGVLPVRSVPFPMHDCIGAPHRSNAGPLLKTLDIALAGCRKGDYAAMVTGPLQKSIIADAGFSFSGHTEYLAQRCNAPLPVMLLAGNAMRVALVTTHLPLRAVADAITPALLDRTLDILHNDLSRSFGILRPDIAVCGLNPHAGEGGHLGHEDDDIILPAIRRQQNKGRDVHGPYPADTVFNHAGRESDVVLAMFHDQGLPVIKHAGFGDIVNVTLGLPIIRTSVDHGSALDIAGTGKASETSLVAAITLASELSVDWRNTHSP